MNSFSTKLTLGSLLIVGVIMLLVIILYIWPLRTASLQRSDAKPMTYNQSVSQITALRETESSSHVTPECASTLMTHGQKTAKTIVMFHGLTACPNQFKELASKFFAAGYNVYIPLAPYHGTENKKRHGNIVAQDLANYATKSMNIASGLGEEAGVIGLSGGGMIATWVAEYRPEIKRALIMSPFYEPAATQAPKWQLQPLHVLYGFHILPDKFSTGETTFSYRALANYDILAKNLKKTPSSLGLTHLALVTTPADNQVDLTLAAKIPRDIAAHNPTMKYIETTLPADWRVDHDMVSATQPTVVPHKDQLYTLFFDAYEGRKTKL